MSQNTHSAQRTQRVGRRICKQSSGSAAPHVSRAPRRQRHETSNSDVMEQPRLVQASTQTENADGNEILLRKRVRRDPDSQVCSDESAKAVHNMQLRRKNNRFPEKNTSVPIQPEDGQGEKFFKDLEQQITCSICQDITHDCISVSPCQHSFCGGCYSDWMDKSDTCPQCRKVVHHACKNHILRNIVELFLKSNPDKRRSSTDLNNLDSRNKIKEGSVAIKKARSSFYPTEGEPDDFIRAVMWAAFLEDNSDDDSAHNISLTTSDSSDSDDTETTTDDSSSDDDDTTTTSGDSFDSSDSTDSSYHPDD